MKIHYLLLILWAFLITGCEHIQTEVPLTDEDIVVVPNSSAFGGPTEVSIIDLSTLLVTKLSEAQEESPILNKHQQMLESLIEASKKQPPPPGIGEITLFFDRGSSSLEFSYLEHERLISFLDHVGRMSQGRKVLFACVGSSSGRSDDANNIELSVLRSKEPVFYIKKYLINIPFEVVSTYGVGSTQAKVENNKNFEENAKYQHVRIVATFERDKLPLPPE